MVDLISALLPAPSSLPGLDLSVSSFGAPVVAGFGPDFLLGALGAQTGSSGGTYDALGRLPPARSPAGRKRAAALNDAKSRLKAGDTVGARAVAEGLVRDNNSDPTAIYIVGRTYLEEGDYKSAERFMTRAASLGGDNEQIQSDLRAVRTLQRGEDASVSQLERLLKNRDTAAEGRRLATYLLQAHPENLDARIALADGYEADGRVDLAGGEFVEALDKTPSDRQPELLDRLERFAAAHPGDPGGYDLLARAQALAGSFREAEENFARALELSADDLVFQRGLKKDFAAVYSKLGRAALDRGDETVARRHFERAVKLSRDDTTRGDLADLETRAGERAMAAGMTGTALRAFGRAASVLPDDSKDRRDQLIKDYDKLAGRFDAAGDLRRVAAARTGAFLLDTKDSTRRRSAADADDTYGLSLFHDGRYLEAIKAFRAALKLVTGDANYTSHLNDALAAL